MTALSSSSFSRLSSLRWGESILVLSLLAAGALVAVALGLGMQLHRPLASLPHAFGAWSSSADDIQTYCFPGVRTSAAEQDENDVVMGLMAPNLDCFSVSAASGRLIRSFQVHSPPAATGEHGPYTDRPGTPGSLLFYAKVVTALSRAWSAEGYSVDVIDTLGAALRSFGAAPDQGGGDVAACQTQTQAPQHRFGIPPLRSG